MGFARLTRSGVAVASVFKSSRPCVASVKSCIFILTGVRGEKRERLYACSGASGSSNACATIGNKSPNTGAGSGSGSLSSSAR